MESEVHSTLFAFCKKKKRFDILFGWITTYQDVGLDLRVLSNENETPIF